MVLRAMSLPVPLQIPRSPLATAETISRLESFSKLDSCVNGTPFTGVDGDNRRY